MKFQTIYDKTPVQYKPVADFTPSLTVPDLSYSIREIFEKYTNGMDLGLQRPVNYSLDPDLEFEHNMSNPLDLTDIDEVKYQAELAQKELQEYRNRQRSKGITKPQSVAKRSDKAINDEADEKNDIQSDDSACLLYTSDAADE